MTNNPYVQVALTYLRRPFSSWKLGLLFVFGFFAMLLVSLVGGRNGNHREFIFPQVMPFVFLFVFLVVHAKDQFVDSRAHLTPGFRRIHATIAGAAVFVCAVFLPAVFAWLIGWHPTGFVAVMLLLFGEIFWILLSLSGWLSWLALIGWLLLLTEPGRQLSQQFVSGKFGYQAVGIMAVGAVVILLGGIRLFRLNEDMPEYRWVRWDRASGRAEVIGPKVTQDPIMQRLNTGSKTGKWQA